MKGFLKILAVAVLTLMVLAGTLAAQNIRIVCIVTALTGSVAQNGEYITRGINMALDEINAKGGVGGRRLEVVFLDDQAKATAAAAVDYLKKNSDAKVVLAGFVDSTGDAAANEELAKHRAQAVRDALTQGGVAADRIDLRKPEVITAGQGADSQARRVDIVAAP